MCDTVVNLSTNGNTALKGLLPLAGRLVGGMPLGNSELSHYLLTLIAASFLLSGLSSPLPQAIPRPTSSRQARADICDQEHRTKRHGGMREDPEDNAIPFAIENEGRDGNGQG